MFAFRLRTFKHKKSPSFIYTENNGVGWPGCHVIAKLIFVAFNKHAEIPANSNSPANRAARFSKAPETFRARKAIFSSSVSKNREVYGPETCCMKGTCVHIKNM